MAGLLFSPHVGGTYGKQPGPAWGQSADVLGGDSSAEIKVSNIRALNYSAASKEFRPSVFRAMQSQTARYAKKPHNSRKFVNFAIREMRS
jgi:hypothetical protein